MKFWRVELKEKLFFDNSVSKAIIAVSSVVLGVLLILLGKVHSGTEILAKTHRADLSDPISNWITQLFRKAIAGTPGLLSSRVRTAIHGFPDQIVPTPSTSRFHSDPSLLLDGCISVLKSPGENERGVLYFYYSYIYPLFLRHFDAHEVAQKYHLVIEPSWSGYCDLNILCLTSLRTPVFVGSIEPRDSTFVQSASPDLIPVSIGGNTWIDTRVFRPLPEVTKDLDVICVAAWSGYKRHWAIFRALRELKQRGRTVRIALVGYAMELQLSDIRALADQFEVGDCVSLYEKLSSAEVNQLLNRSKVNLLWSRREGVNRAIIEGMAANVPCIVRAGFNYGFPYPYINKQTGRFCKEEDLPDCLAYMIDNYQSFSPRDWILSRMTPEHSTAVLNDAVRTRSLEAGERWTTDLVAKINSLDGLTYYRTEDRQKFDEDYRFLRSMIRASGSRPTD
ncbi:MAG: glycosyltransferase [Burkholderiaceae bacterium]